MNEDELVYTYLVWPRMTFNVFPLFNPWTLLIIIIIIIIIVIVIVIVILNNNLPHSTIETRRTHLLTIGTKTQACYSTLMYTAKPTK